MNKIIYSFIGFIILFICIIAIGYHIHLRYEVKEKTSDIEAGKTIQLEKSIINTDVYQEFLKNYNCQGKECYHSFIELDGYDFPLLLLSDSVYKDNNDLEVTMCADIYYPVNNKVTLFGAICSGGTAYPISADSTSIYTAGGHTVAKYNLDIENKKLNLISNYFMCFYRVTDKVNAISIAIIGDENKIVSEEEFNKAYDEYANAKTIYFNKIKY